MLAKMWRKGNPCALLEECKLVQPLWKIPWKLFKKLKIELPYDPAIPFLSIYPKEMKTLTWIDIHTPTFTAALSTMAKTWKRPKCPMMGEWIKKMGIYICIGTLFSHKKDGNLAILNSVDGPWGHYAEWNKSDKEGQIPYDLTLCGM